MRSEIAYRNTLIKKLEKLFPNCFIVKNDPLENQGVPDILILFGNTWAMLEVKRSASAHVQPNQEYFVNRFNEMSFASFIFPEIEEQVLYDLQSTFGASW